MRSPEFLVGFFEHLVARRAAMNDQVQANALIETGKQQIAAQQWESLRTVNARLYDVLPQQERASKEFQGITGVV
jgi:molecular chaperone DnaK